MALTTLAQLIEGADRVVERDIRYARMINELVRAGLRPGKREIEIIVIRPVDPLPGELMTWDPRVTEQLITMGYNRFREVVG